MSRFFIAINPGFYNKGDAALIEGSINCLRSIDGSSVSLLSLYPDYDRKRCDAEIVSDEHDLSNMAFLSSTVSALRWAQYITLGVLYRLTGIRFISDRLVIYNNVWKEFCECDVVIAGLNDSFTTIYGPGSFFSNFITIFLGKLLRKKVILYGSSIGPFRKRRYEILARYILSKPDLITLREELSYNYLKTIGVKNPNIHVTADLAFFTGTAPESRVKEIMKFEGIGADVRPLIGISMSTVIARWAYPDVPEKQEKYQRYTGVIAKIADALIEKTGATIVFIPHVIEPDSVYDDRDAQRQIYAKMKYKENAILVESEYGPGELRGLIGHCDLFIGARTHSVISAAITYTPFVALEYVSFKTRGIIGIMLQCEDMVFDIRELDYDRLMYLVNKVWENRVHIREELQKKMAPMERQVSMNKSLVEELMGKRSDRIA